MGRGDPGTDLLTVAFFVFPGQPVWSGKRGAIEIKWRYRGEVASAWIPRPALAPIAADGAPAHEVVRAVFLHRAQLEHAIEVKVRRRRTARGDLSLSKNDVWRATQED